MSYAIALYSSVLETWKHQDEHPLPLGALAASRALLAAVCVLDLVWREGTPGGSLLIASLTLYGAWCAVIAVGVRGVWTSPYALQMLVRCLDVCAIGLIALIDNPFGTHFVVLISLAFILVSYSGGVRHVLTTTAVVGAIVIARSLVKPLSYPMGPVAFSGVRQLATAHALTVGVTGILFTWAQQRRRFAARGAAATMRLLGAMRPELGVPRVLGAALTELVGLAEARTAILVLEERATRRLRVATLADRAGKEPAVHMRRVPGAMRAAYFFDLDDAPIRMSTGAGQPEHGAVVQVLAAAGLPARLPAGFRSAHSCKRFHAFAFRAGESWSGRLFLLDPSDESRHRACIRSIVQLLEELVPSVASICDLNALRRRAAAAERARIVRELHDGIVQQLVSIEVELALLRRHAVAPEVAGGLDQLQQRLQAELVNLRAFMQRTKSYDVVPRRLPQILGNLVDRFASDTGITARLVCDSERVDLPSQVCGELARIVQEALVNVRRHSRARQVIVSFACHGRDWHLSIEDDGVGFQVRVAAPDADASAVRPPAVIAERVHAIGGHLRLGTQPGCGARLDISSRA